MSNFPSTVYRLSNRPAAKAESDEPAPRESATARDIRERAEAYKKRIEEFPAKRAARIELIRQRAKAFETRGEFKKACSADYSWLYSLHDFDLFEEICAHMV
jgi:hypothetical protein